MVGSHQNDDAMKRHFLDARPVAKAKIAADSLMPNTQSSSDTHHDEKAKRQINLQFLEKSAFAVWWHLSKRFELTNLQPTVVLDSIPQNPCWLV